MLDKKEWTRKTKLNSKDKNRNLFSILRLVKMPKTLAGSSQTFMKTLKTNLDKERSMISKNLKRIRLMVFKSALILICFSMKSLNLTSTTQYCKWTLRRTSLLTKVSFSNFFPTLGFSRTKLVNQNSLKKSSTDKASTMSKIWFHCLMSRTLQGVSKTSTTRTLLISRETARTKTSQKLEDSTRTDWLCTPQLKLKQSQRSTETFLPTVLIKWWKPKSKSTRWSLLKSRRSQAMHTDQNWTQNQSNTPSKPKQTLQEQVFQSKTDWSSSKTSLKRRKKTWPLSTRKKRTKILSLIPTCINRQEDQ